MRESTARKTFIFRRYTDGTVKLKFGRYTEVIDPRNKSALELFEALEWAAITAGISLSDELLAELWREAKGLKEAS